MPILRYNCNGEMTYAELEYDNLNDHVPVPDLHLTMLHTLEINKLIIFNIPRYGRLNLDIMLPSFYNCSHLIQLDIRRIKLQNNILPPLPQSLITLSLYHTNITVLDNLPSKLQILTIHNNQLLTNLVLPPILATLFVLSQTNLRVLTLPPTIISLSLCECRVERINRFSIPSIEECIQRPSITRCSLPYPLLLEAQRIHLFPPTSTQIFNEIQTVNRKLDEEQTSIFYRLREYSYTHSTPTSSSEPSPIINALCLASNPPRRFTEFLIDY